MSQGTACRCDNRRAVVLVRHANYSAFNGYHFTPSDYSEVGCCNCGMVWRTKAAWVETTPDGEIDNVVKGLMR